MLIFRKQTRKQKISFLPSPSLKHLDFYDVSKNSEHINTFRGARLTKSPSQIPKFNFLEQKKKVNAQNGKVFKNFFHNGELKSFTQKKSQGKRRFHHKLIQTF